MLSGREYHRQLSLFNPYSVLFQTFFSNDIISLLTQVMVIAGLFSTAEDFYRP